ncbi:extracellular triacylglycerol lipase precursor [Mycena crocata]|nr:extracellular triacylglycerol lipase precursor [Mycena crocata]
MLLFVALVAPPLLVFGSPATVQLGNLTLVGRELPLLKQTFFGGIPYAEPPVGPLRLRPPILKSYNEHESIAATDFGPACLQADLPLAQMSEDCLTVNVFRPSTIPPDTKLPVLFWTYGGAFVTGSAATFNGSAIVAQSVARGTPVIYVNFNYRIGPLGFPQGIEAAAGGSLNLGAKDQLAALEWVQRYIGHFGGDKDKVTLFGQSAGSIMISVLFLNSSLSRLARAAIFESGSQATENLLPINDRETDWQNFVGGVEGCAATATSGSTFDCLRTVNTTQIFHGLSAAAAQTTQIFPWALTLDGPGGIIPDLPSDLLKRGEFAKLPFIAGTNLDEATIFTDPSINSTDQLRAELVALSSPPYSPGTSGAALDRAIDALLQRYPEVPALGSPFNTGNETFGLNPLFKRAAAVGGDLNFLSQRRTWIEAAANAGVETFGYLFTQPQPNSPPAIGVFHSAEIPFVYGAPNDVSESASLLSRRMIDYWVSFATSLTPNDGLGTSRPEWTQFTPTNKVIMQLNGQNTTMVPDDFHLANRSVTEQTVFINSDPIIWRH